MKKMISLLFGALCALVMIVPAFGAGVPQDNNLMLMLGSEELLRLYAKGQVVSGSVQVWSKSLDRTYEGGIIFIEEKGVGATEVLAKLARNHLDFRVLNSDDPIQWWVTLYNSEGRDLFRGYSEVSLSDIGEGHVPKCVLLQMPCPLPTGGINEAFVMTIGSDGQTVGSVSLDLIEGQPLFPPWFCGAPNGVLVLVPDKGETQIFRLWDPVRQSPVQITSRIESKIAGDYEFTDPERVEIGALDRRPTATITITAQMADVIIDVTGWVDGEQTWERPTHLVSVDLLEFGLEAASQPLDENGPTMMNFFGPGKFEVFFRWRKFAPPPTIWFGGEKGLK